MHAMQAAQVEPSSLSHKGLAGWLGWLAGWLWVQGRRPYAKPGSQCLKGAGWLALPKRWCDLCFGFWVVRAAAVGPRAACGCTIYANTNLLYPISLAWYADQGHPTDLIRWGEAVRLEPLGPDSGVLSWGGNQAFSTGSALGSAISRRTTSPNGPHILHPHC